MDWIINQAPPGPFKPVFHQISVGSLWLQLFLKNCVDVSLLFGPLWLLVAGRLRTSFRSGNLAEDLGVLLLKGIAAVADVPRPEDVGLDAIATLLRRDPDGNCYAEDSFLVQLKAESIIVLEYQAHELTWFLGQTQPMFIGHVSLARSEISLYPTLTVNQAALALHAKRATIHFGTSDLEPFLPGQSWGRWTGQDDWGADVWLGPPVLRWTLTDLGNHDWTNQAYSIVKRFLALARRELELLSFGQSSILEWSTNDLESISSRQGMMKGGNEDLASLVDRCTPAFRAILMRAIMMPGDSGTSLSLPLLALVAGLRGQGVEIDPGDMFGKLFVALQQAPHRAQGAAKENPSPS